MTVIAWDGKTLAADRMQTYAGTVGQMTKIHRVGECLVGGAGESSFINAMIDWVRQGRRHENFPDHQRDKDDWQPLLLVEPDGNAYIYTRTPFPVKQEQKLVAIGSGREFALAAMYCGKTAAQAVLVAEALCTDCGCGVDELTL